jgi:hypothetical protein
MKANTEIVGSNLNQGLARITPERGYNFRVVSMGRVIGGRSYRSVLGSNPFKAISEFVDRFRARKRHTQSQIANPTSRGSPILSS